MYGVPENLDLQRFHGDAVTQVCLGQYDLQFAFRGGSVISVQGGWELRDSGGNLVDQAADHSNRDCYRVHLLLDAAVTGSQVDPPKSFTLSFENGLTLTIFDDSDQYESFSIQPGDIFV